MGGGRVEDLRLKVEDRGSGTDGGGGVVDQKRSTTIASLRLRRHGGEG